MKLVLAEKPSVAPIRKDDVYGGYCVRLDAIYDTIVTPLSIDVSTGDIITPSAVKYEFGGIFDENVKITYGDTILKKSWQKKWKLF